MKRTFPALLLLFIPVVLFAGDATHTYLVATRPAAVAAGGETAFDTDQLPVRVRERMTRFEHVNGFAADLTDSEAAEMGKLPGVRYVERAAERHILGIGANAVVRNLNGQTTPYGIDLVDAPATWVATRGAGINVAIVDTGIDYNHPDLHDQFAGGYNAITKTNDPFDDSIVGHGTHVAGIVAAEDNTIGVVGVAPKTRIWSVKVLPASGTGTTATVIAGIDWVMTTKAQVGGDWIISESLGSSDSNNLEQEMTTQAINAGIIVVAASGNDSTVTTPAPVSFPAAYPGVLAIGAVDSTSTIADFSNQGPELAFVAPGVDVLSTLPVGTGSYVTVTTDTATDGGAPLTGSPHATVSGPVVFCGLGNPSDFPSDVKGKIALIQRGTLTFHDKAKNALAAGATAVVIFNKDDSPLDWTLILQNCDSQGKNCVDDPADLAFAWPLTVGITLEDGLRILDRTRLRMARRGAQQNWNGAITVVDRADDYGVLSGTSMATPHASGVVALVWSAMPSASPSQVINAMTVTAKDLGAAGRDNVYGNGLLDAVAAARMLNPAAFGTSTTPPPAHQ